MSERTPAPLRAWLAAPLGRDVTEALERLRRAPDVQQIAVMPDVHLAADVCVGVVVAASELLYPQAVGGDIGCGMLAVALDGDAAALEEPRIAGQILAGLTQAVPARRRNRRSVIEQPRDVVDAGLSDPRLDALRRDEGALEFATLGSGNHFLELQADESGRLWLLVHSGSRALGPAIRDHHLARAASGDGRLRGLEAGSAAGLAYRQDAAWARRFAAASRRAIAGEAGAVLAARIGARLDWETAIATDHNHVAWERHGGRDLWVHRKGAMSAQAGERGVLPGSMGTPSFHVEGRGEPASLCSSAHGAGRVGSRGEARARISVQAFRRQMEGVWYDTRAADRLVDEAPGAYKDIRAVLRAQRDLVKTLRRLRPVLSYKGA